MRPAFEFWDPLNISGTEKTTNFQKSVGMTGILGQGLQRGRGAELIVVGVGGGNSGGSPAP